MAEINPTHQYNGREERSDTLRSDQESDAEGQGGISSNLKGSRPKRSAFQITSVEPKGKDNNHGTEDADSQDELEESRIDDASSSELLDVSNLSKGSLNSDIDKSVLDDSVSKGSVSLPDRTESTTVLIETLNTDETASNDGTADTNGNGPSRFRVVKVPNPEPVKRGRWTCKDFPSEANQGQVVQEKSELGKESIHSGDSSAASSVHFVPGEATDTFTDEVKSRSKRPPSRQTSSRKTSVLDSIMKLTGVEVEDDESAATAGAIDNKIEQAMDIVKGHLLMAVREEVEVLKEQINELLDANEQLRKENTMLREEKSSSQPHSQMQLNMGAGPSSTQETQYQGIQANPSTQQMHASSTYHQHSLQGQPSMSSSTSTGAPPPTEHYPPPATHHHHPTAQEQPPFMPGEEQATSYHAIPSQPPSTVTTNPAPAEQYHHQQQAGAGQSIVHASQDGQYSAMQQQQPPTQQQQGSQVVEPHTSGTLNPSQYQAHASIGGSVEQHGQYQPPPVHHQLGASAQEHSQPVPPPTAGAIPSHSQGEPQQGHL